MICFLCVLFTLPSAHAASRIRLSLEWYWGDSLLATEKIVSDTAGQQYVWEQCRIYLSGLQACSKKEHMPLQPDVLLLGTEDDSVQSWEIPLQGVEKISGLIGIDSSMQVSGVYEGSLDPGKGMYWTWQAGYIHIKLEGKRQNASGRWIPFRYHLGGYRSPYSTLREWSAAVVNGEAIVRIDLRHFTASIPEDMPAEVMSPGLHAVLLSELFVKSLIGP